MKKLRWGVLSTARIALQKVIPAIQGSRFGEVVAIASRDPKSASRVAERLGIPTACASYDTLLQDKQVEAVYIPLPNHLHVRWAVRALEAGKHVLCEKPIAMSASDAKRLTAAAAQHPNLQVAEAFMYRHHPQWTLARSLVRQGRIGILQNVHVYFTYHNVDPSNIRNQLPLGGGALMDIGCYGISVARWLFERDPTRVSAVMKRHPEFQTDALTTFQMDFVSGTATVTCGTQSHRHQQVTLLGTEGRISLPLPFNAPPDEKMRVEHVHLHDRNSHILKAANQYAQQCDDFAEAVWSGKPLLTPLCDAIRNMRVIDACVASASEGRWVYLRTDT